MFKRWGKRLGMGGEREREREKFIENQQVTKGR